MRRGGRCVGVMGAACWHGLLCSWQHSSPWRGEGRAEVAPGLVRRDKRAWPKPSLGQAGYGGGGGYGDRGGDRGGGFGGDWRACKSGRLSAACAPCTDGNACFCAPGHSLPLLNWQATAAGRHSHAAPHPATAEAEATAVAEAMVAEEAMAAAEATAEAEAGHRRRQARRPATMAAACKQPRTASPECSREVRPLEDASWRGQPRPNNGNWTIRPTETLVAPSSRAVALCAGERMCAN